MLPSLCCSSHENTHLADYVKRALSNDLYCYVEGSGLLGKLLAILLNAKTEKAGKKIKEFLWNEALLLTHPEGIRQATGLSKEEIKEMQKRSRWIHIFDYDEYIIE